MIYVVRHGQTGRNVKVRCQGWSDTELNQTGIEQAEQLAKILADVKFDVCFSSPLKRALKTAQIIYHSEIIVDQRIKERGKGELEGRTDVKQMVKQLVINYYDPNESRYGIERLADFEKRVHAFFASGFGVDCSVVVMISLKVRNGFEEITNDIIIFVKRQTNLVGGKETGFRGRQI